MVLQDVDLLIDGDAQTVMTPTGEADQTMSEGGAWQGVGHDRLDVLFAFRAVVSMDGVFGDDRVQVFGQVLDQPGARAAAALQRPAAARTGLEAMFLVLIDPGRSGAAMARMSSAGAGTFAALSVCRVGVGLL